LANRIDMLRKSVGLIIALLMLILLIISSCSGSEGSNTSDYTGNTTTKPATSTKPAGSAIDIGFFPNPVTFDKTESLSQSWQIQLEEKNGIGFTLSELEVQYYNNSTQLGEPVIISRSRWFQNLETARIPPGSKGIIEDGKTFDNTIPDSFYAVYTIKGNDDRGCKLTYSSRIDFIVTHKILLDDFENGISSKWFVGKDSTANGSLNESDGYTGIGATLSYAFTGKLTGEKSVWATYNLAEPAVLSSLSFRAKVLPGVSLEVRITDDSGQSLQYDLTRPFYETDINSWLLYSLNLDSPTNHWGGANDGKPHNPVRSVSIVVCSLADYNAVGDIVFDDIEGSNDAIVFNLSQATASPVTSTMETLADRLGINIHFPKYPNYEIDERALDSAKAAGFTWIRMDCPLSDVLEKNGTHDFSHQDKLVEAVEKRGMKLIFILHGNADVANLPPTTTSAVKAFGNYVYQAAKRYSGHNVVWEIWNEPNIANFWAPSPNATRYTDLLEEAISRIREGNPDAQIITGGLMGYDFSYLEGCLDSAAFGKADAIGIHPYSLSKPEDISDYTYLANALIRDNLSFPGPIWATEWGYSSTSFGNGDSLAARNKQALFVARELLSSWAEGFPLLIYYDVRDDGSDPMSKEHNFGLLTNDYKDKPSLQAVQTLTRFASERKLDGIIQTTPSSLHMLRLKSKEDNVFVAWYDMGDGKIEISLPANASVYDLLGNQIPVQSTISISENDGPVYILVPN
jgi:hypothetical protein